MEELGYPIDTNSKSQKYLQFDFGEERRTALASDELLYLQDLLQQFASQSPQAAALLQKFDFNLSLIPLADTLPQLHANRIVQLIRTGLDTDTCLLLKGYRSLTGDDVRDRRVEPLDMTADYRYLIAWDLEKDDQRQFKLSRIEDVDYLDQKVSGQHIASPMDIFGVTGEEWTTVVLELNNLSHHLLIEEFPLATQFIRKRSGKIFFQGQVRHFKGIGRFVLGLPSDIEVVQPAAFREYLNGKVRGF